MDSEEDLFFSCNECSRVFFSKSKLNSHKKIHESQKLLQLAAQNSPIISLIDIRERIKKTCPKCQTEVSLQDFDVHLASHSSSIKVKKVEEFEKASEPFPSSPLKNHSHLRVAITCDVCGKVCWSRVGAVTHRRSHFSKKMPELELNGMENSSTTTSSEGTQSSRDPPELSIETSTNNDGENFETCQTCGDAVMTSDLLVHVSTHMLKGQLDCLYCEFEGGSHVEVIEHIATHYELKSYTCSVPSCAKSFHWKNGLLNHTANFHPDILNQSLACIICGLQFGTVKERRSHMLTHTSPEDSALLLTLGEEDGDEEENEHEEGGGNEEEDNYIVPNPEVSSVVKVRKKCVRPFECRYCHKRYFKKKQLKVHEVTHTVAAAVSPGEENGLTPLHAKPRRKKNNDHGTMLFDLSDKTMSPIVLNGGGDEKKETVMNGETEVSNGDNDKEGSEENDVSMTSVASSEESEVPKKKKGKNHPPPPIPRPAVEEKRTSPRKKDVDETGTYLKFIHKNPEDMTESSSDEEEDPSVHGEESDEDDDDNEDDEEEGDEEDEEGEEEESSDEEDYEEAEDDELLSNIQEPGYDSGATAVMAVMKWTPENKLSLWVANAGDSRCVVSRNGTAVEMSVDHKPEDIEECRRIVKAGGKVTAEGRVNGGLNLSRAIGDHSYKCNPSLPLKEQMITSFPDVQQLELSPGTDEFLVLACDGIWNSMSSQEVVDFVGQRLKDPAKIPLSQICDELFKTCLAEDTGGDGTGCDNMTAIIVRILDPKDKTSCGVKRPLNGSILEENEAKKIKTSEDTD